MHIIVRSVEVVSPLPLLQVVVYHFPEILAEGLPAPVSQFVKRLILVLADLDAALPQRLACRRSLHA